MFFFFFFSPNHLIMKLVHNIQKKQHRERAQPVDRKKWGLLEKKKDYKLRAQDYHKKQARLKVLKSKASQRNPDEYYHAMTARKTDNRGIIHADRGNETLSVDEAALLKTQDANYINTMRMRELGKIEKENAELKFESSGKHTVFVDNQQDKEDFDPAEYFQTDERLLERRENRLRLDQLLEEPHDELKTKKKLEEKKIKKYKLLQARMEREGKLKSLQDRMNMQREVMKKGEKKKIVGKDGKTCFKWKTERKR